jgi:tetratricopeptide (TPR) repeat protein
MKIRIYFWLLFSSYAGFTQQPYLKNLDGLQNEKKTQKRDSLVVYNLYTLSKIITPKQEFWVDSLRSFSVKENSKIGYILWQLMNDEKEIRKLNYAVGVQRHLNNAKLLEKNNYHSYASWPYLRAGILFARVSSDIVNKKNALDYYEKGLSLAISTKDTSEIIRAYDYIGEYYLDTKQLPKAIENLEKAADLLEKAEDKNLYPTVLASLGSCYLLQKNEKKANQYYKKMNEHLTNSGFKFADFYEGYIKNIYY